ncbi:hypothetical protein COSO111634_30415 [Corallococcus soli]
MKESSRPASEGSRDTSRAPHATAAATPTMPSSSTVGLKAPRMKSERRISPRYASASLSKDSSARGTVP